MTRRRAPFSRAQKLGGADLAVPRPLRDVEPHRGHQHGSSGCNARTTERAHETRKGLRESPRARLLPVPLLFLGGPARRQVRSACLRRGGGRLRRRRAAFLRLRPPPSQADARRESVGTGYRASWPAPQPRLRRVRTSCCTWTRSTSSMEKRTPLGTNTSRAPPSTSSTWAR